MHPIFKNKLSNLPTEEKKSKRIKKNKENILAYLEITPSPKSKSPIFHTTTSDEKISYYSLAKEAEFQMRNLKMAEFYYNLAIKNNERVDSAVKDLATVIHQRGRTEEACELLEKFRPLYRGDSQKYENLIKNLKKQIKPTGNCLLKQLLMVLDKNSNETLSTIPMFFTNSSRILEIKSIKNGCCLFDSAQEMFKDFAKESYFGLNAEINSVGKLFLLTFSSYSQAKKTLDTLNKTVLAIFWVNSSGRVISKAWKNQMKIEQNKNRMNEPIWPEYLFFSLEEPFDRTKNNTTSFKEIWPENFNPSPIFELSTLSRYQKALENKLTIELSLSSLSNL